MSACRLEETNRHSERKSRFYRAGGRENIPAPKNHRCPDAARAFSQELFASHAGSLALRDALSAGDNAPSFANESFRTLLNSPQLIARRGLHFLRALLHPASWPMVIKMTTAMVLAALLPMLITAYYNLNGSVQAVSAGELRNLTRMAESTAGRVSQLITDNENLAKFLATEEDLIDYLKQPNAARKKEADAKLGVLVRLTQTFN